MNLEGRHTWLVFLGPYKQMIVEKSPPFFYTFLEVAFTCFLILDPPSMCSPEIFTTLPKITVTRSTTVWDRRLAVFHADICGSSGALILALSNTLVSQNPHFL